jgi:hypothetical protein
VRRTRKTAIALAILSGALTAARVARASQVRVVDDAGKPVANVMVACTRGSTGAGLSGPDGVATVPDVCREVYCERGDRVNDLVKIELGKATCRVGAGVVMTVKAEPGTCADGCSVEVADAKDEWPRPGGRIEGGVPRRSSVGWIGWTKSNDRSRGPGWWTSKPIAPGHLKLYVNNELDDVYWSCALDLGVVAAGASQATAVMRAPVEVKGRVLDRDGNPVSDVPLFANVKTPVAEGDKRAWACSAMSMNAMPVSGPDGSFRLKIDPIMAVQIDAGWKDYPIGTASATVQGRPDCELVLRLK